MPTLTLDIPDALMADLERIARSSFTQPAWQTPEFAVLTLIAIAQIAWHEPDSQARFLLHNLGFFRRPPWEA